MRTPRLLLLVIAGLLTAGAVASLFDSVSATAIGGGMTWPCGSVVEPLGTPPEGLAAGTPERGRMEYLLGQASCASRREKQLAVAIRFLLAATPLAIAAALIGRRPGVRSDAEAYAHQP